MELDPQFAIGDSVFLFKNYPAEIYMTDPQVTGKSAVIR